MPAAFYRQFDQQDISGFCVRHGLYCLPTIELADLISRLILQGSRTRSAIEIGSGNGALGKALGVPCTDSYLQNLPHIRALYELSRQPVVTYGAHVEQFDAKAAVAYYRPEVVIAAWVTHKYEASDAERGGNMYGVDEVAILQRIKRYIFVGHTGTHATKPLLDIPHQIIEGDFIFSRAFDPRGNRVFVWDHV
jgi:hypothetical protein